MIKERAVAMAGGMIFSSLNHLRNFCCQE